MFTYRDNSWMDSEILFYWKSFVNADNLSIAFNGRFVLVRQNTQKVGFDNRINYN